MSFFRTVIGVTSLEIYTKGTPEWLYEFGESWDPGPPRARVGLVSYYRMDDRIYGERGSEDRIVSRTEKLIDKYVGRYYFDLPLSSNPRSAMYNLIRSRRDLDRMARRLPIEKR